MASIRRVRKGFREEVRRLVSTGEGNFESLVELAGKYFGRDVGYEVLIKTFLGTEVGNAVSYLRNEGLIETVGKKWKLSSDLQLEDVEIISVRRLKRLRGELKAEVRLAHNFGRTEEAIAASKMLDIVSQQLTSVEVTEEVVTPPVE